MLTVWILTHLGAALIGGIPAILASVAAYKKSSAVVNGHFDLANKVAVVANAVKNVADVVSGVLAKQQTDDEDQSVATGPFPLENRPA